MLGYGIILLYLSLLCSKIIRDIRNITKERKNNHIKN